MLKKAALFALLVASAAAAANTTAPVPGANATDAEEKPTLPKGNAEQNSPSAMAPPEDTAHMALSSGGNAAGAFLYLGGASGLSAARYPLHAARPSRKQVSTRRLDEYGRAQWIPRRDSRAAWTNRPATRAAGVACWASPPSVLPR